MKAQIEIAKIVESAGKLAAMIRNLDELQHSMRSVHERDADADLAIEGYADRIAEILGAFDE